MTLERRALTFGLTALACVLLAFSTALTWLTANDLDREQSDRLESALATLSAIVERGEQGWEWEPHGRQLIVGGATAADALPWCVGDDRGHIVDRSQPPLADDFFRTLDAACQANSESERSARLVEWSRQPWRARQRLFRLDSAPPSTLVALTTDEDAADDRADVAAGLKKVLPAMTMTVAVPLGPMRDKLRRLIVTLALVSSTIWLLAALFGRELCRRALRPITTMAAAASEINATRLEERLPVGDSRDELQDLSRAFNALLDRLHESFDQQRRFTGEASHQLRTPLTAMLGHVDVTLLRDRSPEEYRDTLNVVRRQTDHLSRIVEALLFLARADAEAAAPESETIVLAEWLREFSAAWQTHPRAADLRFVNEIDDGTTLRVATIFVTEILNTLLHNACQYSDAGTSILLRITRVGEHVRFDITDHGHGIAVADVPHLFQPFFRSETSRLRGIPGIGLGLSVAQRMATAINAELTVVTTLDDGHTGSMFSLTLLKSLALMNQSLTAGNIE